MIAQRLSDRYYELKRKAASLRVAAKRVDEIHGNSFYTVSLRTKAYQLDCLALTVFSS